MNIFLKIILIIIGVVLVAGFLLGIMGFYVALETLKQKGDEQYSAEVVAAFQNEIIGRGVENVGQPIEGFDAFLLMQAFPGLEEQDFDNVKTGIKPGEGIYKHINGELQWQRIADQPVTSAEKTISQEGYKTLLKNLSARLGIMATNANEAKSLVDAIDLPADVKEQIKSKSDLIVVGEPRPLSTIASPLTFSGRARGQWYFEADFPVVLVDWDGLIIAQSHATAQGEWMTEDFVPFEGKIEFEKPAFPGAQENHFSRRGTIIFQKDNPSGLPENDDTLEIPIYFEENTAGKVDNTNDNNTGVTPKENECFATGCSGQICAETEVITTCEFRPEYACYQKYGVCERQSAGQCGWTQTTELNTCLQDARVKSYNNQTEMGI